jgi:hypothetical protein
MFREPKNRPGCESDRDTQLFRQKFQRMTATLEDRYFFQLRLPARVGRLWDVKVG